MSASHTVLLVASLGITRYYYIYISQCTGVKILQVHVQLETLTFFMSFYPSPFRIQLFGIFLVHLIFFASTVKHDLEMEEEEKGTYS